MLPFIRALLIPKLRSKFAEFLHHDSLVRLSVLHQSTGHSLSTVLFLEAFLERRIFGKLCIFLFFIMWLRSNPKACNLNILTIKKSSRIFLGGRLTSRVRPKIPSAKNLRFSATMIRHCLFATHVSIINPGHPFYVTIKCLLQDVPLPYTLKKNNLMKVRHFPPSICPIQGMMGGISLH